jgi:hypothetical protein
LALLALFGLAIASGLLIAIGALPILFLLLGAVAGLGALFLPLESLIWMLLILTFFIQGPLASALLSPVVAWIPYGLAVLVFVRSFEAQDRDRSPCDRKSCLGDFFDGLLGDVFAHPIIDSSSGENDLGVVAEFFGLMGEVIRIDSDAVSADQARTKWQKIPLGTRRLKHLLGVEAHAVKDQGQLVHEGDIEIALGVLNDLGGFCDRDAAGPKDARFNDLLIGLCDQFKRLRGVS